jgi:uncharacterized delta-60 repeat protein
MDTQTPRPFSAGAIDPDFGHEGKVTLNFPNSPFSTVWGLTLTQDSKILVVGSAVGNQFIVGGLTGNGEIDSSFGRDGSIVGQFRGLPSVGRSIHALSDGKLLVTGTVIAADQLLPAVSRLLADGNFDPTFAQDGTFIFSPVKDEFAVETATFSPTLNHLRSGDGPATQSSVLPDGKIIISMPYASDYHGLLIRLTADGVLDSEFNGTGSVSFRYPDPSNLITYLKSFLVTVEGEIVVCGHAELNAGAGPLLRGLLACYDMNGRLDESFGIEGFAAVESTDNITVDDVVAVDDGHFVGVGARAGDQAPQAAIAFGTMADGNPDPGFNNGKINALKIASRSEWYSAATTSLTQSVVVTGIAFDKQYVNQGVIVGRYLKTGELDKQFGNGEGWTTLPPGLEPRLTLQTDGKVLITYQTADAPRACVISRLLG